MVKERGFFITIEGAEAVGKTTFAKSFSLRLDQLGISYLNTREPGGSPTANKMRQIFVAPPAEDPIHMHAEFLLVEAARAQHVASTILPALAEGKVVLCDRFSDSSRVYQGILGGIDQMFLEAVDEFSTQKCEPDLTFLLDAPASLVASRLKNRAAHETLSRYDSKPDLFHEKLLDAFRQLAKNHPQRIVTLNAAESNLVDVAWKIFQQRRTQL